MGGGFCKKTWNMKALAGSSLQNYPHRSLWPLDSDPTVMIGVCIVSTCGLFSPDTLPFIIYLFYIININIVLYKFGQS
jgi:hypothetical protein